MSEQKPVSLAEAARRLGVTSDAVRQRIRRHSLLATRDNYGRLQVFLPDEVSVQNDSEASAHTDRTEPLKAIRAYGQSDDPRELRPSLSAETVLIEELREQIKRLRADLDEARGDLREERERNREDLAKVEASTEWEREEWRRLLEEQRREREAFMAQIKDLSDRIAAVLADREREHAEVTALREAVARFDRPWWRRMFRW